MSNLTQNFPQINSPFVNKDGTITAPWRQFLQALFLRTGGAISPGAGAFAVNDDNSSNHNYFPAWVTVNTGTATASVSSTKLKWNPATSTFTAPFFSGSLLGNAQTTTALQNPRTLSVSGTTGLYSPAVTFDGTSNVSFQLNGTLNLSNGGTASDLSITGGTSQVLRQSSLGGAITVGQLAASDLSNGVIGSGAVVLATSPTLVAPTLGAAVATSLNFGQTNLNFYQEGYWTPVDASGAALTFASASGRYTRIGRMVFAEFYILYPTTTNTNHAIIGGLPFTVGSGVGGGFAPAYFSIQTTWQCNSGATTASAYNTTGGGITNVNLTGATLSGVISYNV